MWNAVPGGVPVHYGQGMSVAALDAVELHHALEPGVDGVASRFFDRVASVVDVVWRMAVGADFGFPQTSGPKPRGTDLSNWYFERLLRRAHTDPILSEAFMRVMRLEQPPATLLKPRIARRVFQPAPATFELIPRLKTLTERGV